MHYIHYYQVWICTRKDPLSEEEAEAAANYRAAKFEEEKNKDLVSLVLGDQTHMDGVNDGIPMARESVQELFTKANICGGDFVLEAGHGSYPRLAALAAIITGMPTLAFEPYEGVFFNFREAIKIRYTSKPQFLHWKYPLMAENIDSRERPQRKCAATIVNYAVNNTYDSELEPSQTEMSQQSSQSDCTQNSNESEE
jgi:hypothetical protein